MCSITITIPTVQLWNSFSLPTCCSYRTDTARLHTPRKQSAGFSSLYSSFGAQKYGGEFKDPAFGSSRFHAVATMKHAALGVSLCHPVLFWMLHAYDLPRAGRVRGGENSMRNVAAAFRKKEVGGAGSRAVA